MKQIIIEKGIEYIKMPRDEYNTDCRTWFMITLIGIGLSFICGKVF